MIKIQISHLNQVNNQLEVELVFIFNVSDSLTRLLFWYSKLYSIIVFVYHETRSINWALNCFVTDSLN
jgi:hypothetical protein